MNALVLANFPIAALIFAAIVGIPLWLTFKRPDRAPRYSQAAVVPATVASGHACPRRAQPDRCSPGVHGPPARRRQHRGAWPPARRGDRGHPQPPGPA